MKKKNLVSLVSVLLAALLLSLSIMGCGSSTAADADADEAEETDEEFDEEDLLEEEEANHDVTAGYVEDGDYYCEAEIGEDDAVSVSVFASEGSVVNSDVSGAPELQESSGTDLDAARKAWLLISNEGDEEAANLDMEDYEELEGPDEASMAELMKYKKELGQLFYQFGVTDYDLTRPSEVSQGEYVFDVYTSKGSQFYLDVSIEDGVLYEVDFQEEIL